MNPTISIIVPVYNAQDYLCQCIESILNQNFQDFELILVNDGSTDSSGEICNDYLKNDSRIKVRHKENGGQSSARNMGLDIAAGKYIGFVDSDDWIHEDMYKALLEYAMIEKADIVACNFLLMKNDGTLIPYNKHAENKVFNRIEALKEIYRNEILTFSPCNKIYNSVLFDELRFTEGIILEDKDISYKLIDKSNKVVYIKNSLYFYRYNNNSTLRSSFSLKRLDEFKVQLDMYEFYKEKLPDVADIVYFEVFNIGSFLYSQLLVIEGRNSISNDYNYLIYVDRNILKRLIRNNQLTLIQRIKVCLGVLAPSLIIRFRKIRNC